MAVLAAGVLASAAYAADTPTPNNLALEQRALSLANELRCLVCQNQTIADSSADLAVDLRRQVREQIQQGKSDEEIVAYMVSRYGDFVLYRPPLKMQTVLLWLGPFLLMAGGLFALVRYLRRGRRPEAEIAPDKLAEAARLLRDDGAPR